MGTPEFSSTILDNIINCPQLDIVAVFTAPDKPTGRGKKLLPPKVKVIAEKHKLPVYQPLKYKKTEELEAVFKELKPDCILVISFGRILPKWLLEVPSKACVNVHGSLLPKYRGASPITAALLNGEEKSGVTLMEMSQKLDSGNMISIRETLLSESDNFQTLHDRLVELSIDIVNKDLPLYLEGKLKSTPQDHDQATYTYQIDKKEGLINWDNPASQLLNFIRAYDPWPSAFSFNNNKRFKFFNPFIPKDIEKICARLEPLYSESAPGQAFYFEDQLFVRTSNEIIGIGEIQKEGKKRLKSADFCRGLGAKGVNKIIFA